MVTTGPRECARILGGGVVQSFNHLARRRVLIEMECTFVENVVSSLHNVQLRQLWRRASKRTAHMNDECGVVCVWLASHSLYISYTIYSPYKQCTTQYTKSASIPNGWQHSPLVRIPSRAIVLYYRTPRTEL